MCLFFFLKWEVNLNRAGGEIKGSCPWHHSLRAKNRTAEQQQRVVFQSRRSSSDSHFLPTLPTVAQYLVLFVGWFVVFFFCLIKGGTGCKIKKSSGVDVEVYPN